MSLDSDERDTIGVAPPSRAASPTVGGRHEPPPRLRRSVVGSAKAEGLRYAKPLVFLLVTIVGAATLAAGERPLLRVCSDPNNLPFSNSQSAGFENKIAELAARDLGRRLTYEWAPQRRGFMRRTLMAGRCDLVMGVPARFEMVRTTRPYYRSTYAFVSRRDRHLDIRSFDDPKLAHLVIGIQITGDDYNNPPPAQVLASRKLAANVRGYTVYGDYSKPDPQRDVVDAVAGGTIDLAVVWGPLAGYYSRREPVPMDVVPVRPDPDSASLPFVFDIAMGVRRDDRVLHDALDAFIARNRPAIRRILQSYGVPLV